MGQHSKLYKGRWTKIRTAHLGQSPLCVFCQEDGKTEPATVVDHITPHRGDTKLFYDPANLQSLCKWHHDSVKARAEETTETGVDGVPTDPSHHWAGGGIKSLEAMRKGSPGVANLL